MFAAIFTFALIAGHVAAEIPSYIHVCGRRDPNLDECIANNIDNLKGKLCDGIPELGVPSANPYFLDKLAISDTPNAKIYIRDAKITGMCDFVVKYLHTDLDKLHYDIELLFNRIQVNTTYDFNIRLLVPIAYKGLVYITLDNIQAKVDLDMNLATRDGRKYTYISKMKVNLDLKNYNTTFDLNGTELGQLHEIVNSFVGNNQEEIFKILKPVLEETISKRVILISNDIVKLFTYEELFPDRT